MIPFQLHRRIPLVRRPFLERDIALQRLEEALSANNSLSTELKALSAERDSLAKARDHAAAARDALLAERDALKAECDSLAKDLPAEANRPFSLARLLEKNPGLARHYLWDSNGMPPDEGALWLHLGCGVRVFDDFINMDICPQDFRVRPWNLLDLWPEEMENCVEGVFSEDCLEHFFFAEQQYVLCNINRALRPEAVARILMPSLSRVVDSYMENRHRVALPLHDEYGTDTAADVLNYGLRFTGHRWVHDNQSLRRMAAACGFDMTPTNCAESTVGKLSGLNLRDESNSASFANDLRKSHHISRILLEPHTVTGATKVEDLPLGAALHVATTNRPTVKYVLPREIKAGPVSCINFRSANLSIFDWGIKTLVIDEHNQAKPWYFDETLKSQPSMNLITGGQIRAALGDDREIRRLHFSPAHAAGEHFTLGCAEVFLLNR
jgi:predicted SAM-dependent methyltransferase